MNLRQRLIEFLEPVRWRIATVLDRFPDTCWMNLVHWAISPDMALFEDCLYQTCSEDSIYCGKCWQTGRLPVEWGTEAFRPEKYWRVSLKRLLGRDAE